MSAARPLAITLATLVALTGLLAVATPAAAAPATPFCDAISDLRSWDAVCETLFVGVAATAQVANCLLNTPPVNWASVCLVAPPPPPLPIVAYLLCYYNTAPANWATVCV
ncbi:MAG TPA: hypothetical protein VM241_09145 [Candidatus Thermoplasmatota archaeon]|nr:hypothetical protein [Candidatus Thermoplasmatota archaeon]